MSSDVAPYAQGLDLRDNEDRAILRERVDRAYKAARPSVKQAMRKAANDYIAQESDEPTDGSGRTRADVEAEGMAEARARAERDRHARFSLFEAMAAAVQADADFDRALGEGRR